MLKEYWVIFSSTIIALIFVITAYAHKLQKDDLQVYVESKLIPIEFTLFLISIGGLLVAVCAVVVFLFKKQWLKMLFGVINLIATYLLISFAMYIDASTLIYMT